MNRALLSMALCALLLTGCKDNYGACEKAALDIGNGIAAGMKTTDQLRVSGQISIQEETNILGYLEFANKGNGAFASCAKTAHDSGAKGAYTACAQQFSAALANPQELALIHVTNPAAQQNVEVLVNAVATGVTAILTALGGA